MAVLVDAAIWSGRGRRWAHLVSDASLEELHDFAAALGLDRRAFHGDHYDLPSERWDAAVERGATPVDPRLLVRRLRASGLRLTAAERRQLTGQVGPGGAVERLMGDVRAVQAGPVEEPG